MKHVSLLLVSLSMIAFAFDTNCMFSLRTKTRLRLPQQKRFCSHQTSLEQRMKALENTVQGQGNELAEIKAIVGRWNNNNQPITTDLVDQPIPHSFIEVHNMHYGNTSHED